MRNVNILVESFDLYLLNGASVAEIRGVKSFTIIAIIYDFGVTTGEKAINRRNLSCYLHEDGEAISKSSTEWDEVNFNEIISFLDDEFIVPRSSVTQSSGNNDYFPYVPAYDPLFTNNIFIPDPITPSDPITSTDPITSSEPIIISSKSPEFTTADDHPVLNEHDDSKLAEDLDIAEDHVSIIKDPISEAEPSTTKVSPSTEVFSNTPIPQDRCSRKKHIELVNILGEPQAEVTTRSRIRDSKAASAHECLYVNFLSEIEPKKLIEALEEEG
ncbi:hypothetical protein Tco_1058254 [Tanacetum coccineum]|uniref:Uncharacterized protein n=1 Tax=Tanacetum coccineum TaxID=301880 RepID=A0ABQ5H7Q0_9ASTR